MFRKLPLSLLILSVLAVGAFSQPAAHPGITLYRDGKYAEAVTSLSAAVKTSDFKNNAEVWEHLGLAQSKSSDNKNARKSLEKAAKLAPNNAAILLHLAYVYAYLKQPSKAAAAVDKAINLGTTDASVYHLRGVMRLRGKRLDEADADARKSIELDPASSEGYLLTAYIALDRLGKGGVNLSNTEDELRSLDSALSVLKSGSERCKESKDCEAIANESEVIGVYRNYFAKDRSSRAGVDPDPSVTPLKILTKPRAAFTDEARKQGKQGTIKVLVLFRADGRIGRPLLLNGLGFGLDENVLRAASQITFEPKKVNGKAVSDVRAVQYSFEIY